MLELIKRPLAVAGFVLLPQRWIVERTFAWLGRYRRQSRDYERLTESSEAMIQISMIHRTVITTRLPSYASDLVRSSEEKFDRNRG